MANRLISETSPYLLQHAHNPVDWYPWGEEALAEARASNRLILISIGYSACHWCHVMERESFEDPATAAFMNKHFVNIKVDREERPDLDQVYMDAVQAISGSGGWPLNVFLTPDARPFYGGTYFPPVRAYNRSSWLEVLQAINQAWTEKPQEILSQSENLTAHIANASAFGGGFAGSDPIAKDDMNAAATQLMKTADDKWGGFGGAPKFPQTFSICFLLRQAFFQTLENNTDLPIPPQALIDQAVLSLDKMCQGGIYDHLGGGFARYSTDIKWLAPHFEKMLYDNALIVTALAEAWSLTGAQRLALAIEETMAFAERDMLSPEGLFYSAYDADSDGVEGKFYTWSKAEILALIGNEDFSQHFCDYYQVSEHGNWEHTNILWTPIPMADFCKERQLEEEVFSQKVTAAKTMLWQGREKRNKPLLDDKVLLGWNALMISAACKAGNALGNSHYIQLAEKCSQAIEAVMRHPDGRFAHNYKAGKASNPAFLDDLAFYAQALIHLAESTGNNQLLEKAYGICKQVIDDFSDEEQLFFYYTPAWQKDIVIRKKDTYDGAIPSGNSTMAANLLSLGTLFDNQEWKERAVRMVKAMHKAVTRYPGSYGNWAQVAQNIAYGQLEVAVVGPDHKALADSVLKRYLPHRVLQQAPGGIEAFPMLAGKGQEGGKTLIYVCRDYSCKRPVETPDEMPVKP